ncbi:MAG: hypothetical protein FJ247_03475 [Nitrospira sp.]|nr:hypothetical protein [Nitrospira sp.]
MHVKGFIIEDDQGREIVALCEPLSVASAKTFSIRGWQRLRLVPLRHTKREYRQIVGGVEATLHDLLDHLPRSSEGAETSSPKKVGAATSV